MLHSSRLLTQQLQLHYSHRMDRIARIEALLAAGEPVILDGGNATELEREQAGGRRDSDRGLGGRGALSRARDGVLDAHRRYVAAGSDVISTNTWAILAAAELESGHI